MKKRQLLKTLRRQVTLMLVPHHSAPSFKLSVATLWVVLAGFLLVNALAASLVVFTRQAHYVRVKKNNLELQKKNAHFSQELLRLNNLVADLETMQDDLKTLHQFIPSSQRISRTAGAQTGEGGFTFKDGQLPDITLSIPEYNRNISYLENEALKLKEGFETLRNTPFFWPAEGRVTSEFGRRVNPFSRNREFHSGIDIANAVGTPIIAPADGVVSAVEWNRLAGRLLTLQHEENIVTKYAHCHRVLVKSGEPVTRGQVIALMGSTGLTTGSHLHYEVQVDNKPVNPRRFMSLKISPEQLTAGAQ